jgi:hypothetical protein
MLNVSNTWTNGQIDKQVDSCFWWFSKKSLLPPSSSCCNCNLTTVLRPSTHKYLPIPNRFVLGQQNDNSTEWWHWLECSSAQHLTAFHAPQLCGMCGTDVPPLCTQLTRSTFTSIKQNLDGRLGPGYIVICTTPQCQKHEP